MSSVSTQRLRANVVLGSLLLMVGGWIRFISIRHYHDEIALTDLRSYPLLLAGQILLALAGPICLNSPAHVSVNWFPRSERHIANFTGIIFFALGVATSQSISSSVVKCVPPESTNPSDIGLEMKDILEYTECDSYKSIEGNKNEKLELRFSHRSDKECFKRILTIY